MAGKPTIQWQLFEGGIAVAISWHLVVVDPVANGLHLVAALISGHRTVVGVVG
jgi:hypothetical protein